MFWHFPRADYGAESKAVMVGADAAGSCCQIRKRRTPSAVAASGGRRRLGKLCDVTEGHSTVTDFARLRGWSTSVPLATAT